MAASMRLIKTNKLLISSFKFIFSPTRCISKSCGRFAGAEQPVQRYDLVVIGGGSGGLACAKEAAGLGKRVAVLDFVTPSPHGTRWGLGGTCVNVGCIPKKLMHQSAQFGENLKGANDLGWCVPDKVPFSWEVLTVNVQNHVKSLNFGHRVQLNSKNVDYLNMKGSLTDRNTVLCTDKSGKNATITADFIVIATGTRPKYPDKIPGALQHAISSDDIFWMKNEPGKTLCVGASSPLDVCTFNVSLETAGFLTGLGYDATVMIRSAPLRQFDQQMAHLVVQEMATMGTKFINGCEPVSIEKVNSQLKVRWACAGHQRGEDLYDTVLITTGRTATTGDMGLQAAGVKVNSDGFVVGGHGGEAERSSVPNIYAIGDVLENCLQLTPVASKSGRLLAHRLFNNGNMQMDYNFVPTTVFTPLEYSFVGMSEEEAERKYGKNGVTVYHAFYTPLEYVLSHKSYEHCYIKVIAAKDQQGRVLGIHYTGPNAGEVMQGFAVAMRCGLTRERLLTSVGIHPTTAEEVVKLNITKESGLDPKVTGC